MQKMTRLALIALVMAAPLAAQKKPFTVEKLLQLHRLSDPQVSPDGRTVLFSVATPDVAKNARLSQVWVVSIEGDAPRQLTREGTRNERPRWSPDGKRIAFISNRGGSQQVWLMDPDGSKARPLTEVPTEAGGVTWSPDGSRLLFTSEVYPDCPDMACNKKRAEERANNPVKAKVFDALLYRHWASYRDDKRSHLFVIAAAGGAPLDLTPGDHDVPPFSLGDPDDYAFSPDGREVAYTSNVEKVEATSTNKDIFLAPVTGSSPKKITTNPAWDGTPRYSPDGRWIAYRAMERPGYESDRFQLLLYDRNSGQHRSLTANYDRSIGFLTWSPDSRRIFFGTEERATHPIVAIEVSGGEPRLVVTGAVNDEPGLTPDGRTLVFTRASLRAPAEVFRAPADGVTGSPQPLTRMNGPLLADTEMATPEAFSYPGAGGQTVYGWLLKPPGFDPNRKYPVMFLLHGGPQSAWNDAWSYRWNAQVFSAAGYVLALFNRTGSTGYGQTFTDRINADWGGRPFEDILRGLEQVAKLPFVDSARIGASGASYGGYLINWIAGHTDRFRCLVSHAGVFDLTSKYGSTEELWFPEWDLRGTPWDNPELYRRLSPSTYIKNFKTPTLVTHGQLDYRVDISQGLQMFTALQRMNVPSKMIYFPDEGHWILKPANSAYWYRQVIGWWDRWLK